MADGDGIPIPEYVIGDRVRYVSDEKLREWAKKESSPATVVGIKIRMFRQGPGFWSIEYYIAFDTPWPVKSRTLSGQSIRELTTCKEHLVLLEPAPTTGGTDG